MTVLQTWDYRPAPDQRNASSSTKPAPKLLNYPCLVRGVAYGGPGSGPSGAGHLDHQAAAERPQEVMAEIVGLEATLTRLGMAGRFPIGGAKYQPF